jgi:hypothetical protein
MGTSQAQISDKLMPHFGFMYEILSLNGASSRSFYLANVGAYYLLGQRSDVFSYGIETNVQVGVNPLAIDRLRLGYLVQVPVYLMARVGANSTPYNEQRVGLGIGVGASFSAYSQYSQLRGVIYSDRGRVLTPEAVAEITINTRGNPLILRGHLSILNNATAFRQVGLDGNQLASPFYEINDVFFFGFGVAYPINL